MYPDPDSVLVVDVGGSHISAAICLSRRLEFPRLGRAALPVQCSADAFMDELMRIGLEVGDGNIPAAGASIAIAGPFDYSAGISRMRHKLEHLYGFDLKLAIASRFGWSPDRIEFLNDADAFLLGEIGAGAAQHARKAVGITLGTGIGSAFAISGELVGTGHGVPQRGEIWNLPYAEGIVEDVLSTRGLQTSYLRRTGVLMDVAGMASLAETDAAAREVFAEFGEHLGSVLRQTAPEFAPDVIAIGGGIARSSQLFLPAASMQLRQTGIRLQVSPQLDHAPLVGAAVRWFGLVGRQSTNRTRFVDGISTANGAFIKDAR